MAKSLLRVHEHLLLLTSDTSKGAAGPAFFQLIAHPRLPGVLPARFRISKIQSWSTILEHGRQLGGSRGIGLSSSRE